MAQNMWGEEVVAVAGIGDVIDALSRIGNRLEELNDLLSARAPKG